jgi:Family of unknown function (DUF6521)
MIPWRERPAEVANLLNPAFCGRLLVRAIEHYDQPMPLTLLMLVLPIILHQDTREALPRSVATSMQLWLERHPEAHIGFAERVREITPFTRETLTFCLVHGRLRHVSGTAAFTALPAPRRRPTSSAEPTEEVGRCLTAAGLVGRWFSLGTPSSVYALWGIRP